MRLWVSSLRISGLPGRRPARKSGRVLPDPGRAPDPGADRPGACAQIAPRARQDGQGQEPGVIGERPPAPRFMPATAPAGQEPAQGLVSIAEAARQLGFPKSSLHDWCYDTCVTVPPSHPAPGNRPGKCFTTDELAAMETVMSRHNLIAKTRRGEWSKTAVKPEPDYTSDVVSAFNAIWARQAPGDAANIQQHPGDSLRAVLLPEVATKALPGDQRVIRQQAPEQDREPSSRMGDIRLWDRPGVPQPSSGRQRRPRRATLVS